MWQNSKTQNVRKLKNPRLSLKFDLIKFITDSLKSCYFEQIYGKIVAQKVK